MIPAIIAAVVILLDQLTKAWVLRTWPEPYTGEIALIPGWLALTYVQNTGVAFGLFTGMPYLFTVTSIVIIVAAVYFYLRHVPDYQPWIAVSLGLIIGGAIGNNLIDRVRFGYVVDFIKTFDGRFPVFNVADSAIVVGVALMALVLTYQDQQQPRAQLQPRAGGDDGR
jgi:signal peptidase II